MNIYIEDWVVIKWLEHNFTPTPDQIKEMHSIIGMHEDRCENVIVLQSRKILVLWGNTEAWFVTFIEGDDEWQIFW